MNAIKLFVAALAALVCFPALAADAPIRTTAGLSVFLLHNVNTVAGTSSTLGCTRTFINPTKIEVFRLAPISSFVPALVFDTATCPSWASAGSAGTGYVVNLRQLYDDTGGPVTATAGAYIFTGNFRRTLRERLENTRW